MQIMCSEPNHVISHLRIIPEALYIPSDMRSNTRETQSSPLCVPPPVACVASVSVRFRSKERGTKVKDRVKNGASKRAGRGWGRKEGNACRQTPGF